MKNVIRTTQPLDHYFSITSYGTPRLGLILMYGGWRTPRVVYMPGVHRLVKMGYAVVLYIPNPDLVSPSTPLETIVEAADFVVRDAAQRIKVLPQVLNHPTIVSMGASFGTLFATEVAKRNKAIKKLVISAPFGDFHDHVRLWEDHPVFGPVVEAQRTQFASPAEILNRVGTVRGLSKLKDKEIYLSYSDNDRVVHTIVTEDLISRLQDEHLNVSVSRTKGGHYTGIYKNYVSLMRDKSFLI